MSSLRERHRQGRLAVRLEHEHVPPLRRDGPALGAGEHEVAGL
jgi:hypothetical protein